MKKVTKIISLIILGLLLVSFLGNSDVITVKCSLRELMFDAVMAMVVYFFYYLYCSLVVESQEPVDGIDEVDSFDMFLVTTVSTAGMILIMLSVAVYLIGRNCINELNIPHEAMIEGKMYLIYPNKFDAYSYIGVGVLIDVLALLLPFMIRAENEKE